MRRRIWIPDGLYRWLPGVALVTGASGVAIGGFGFGMLLVSMLTASYGGWIMALRLYWMGAEL